MRELKVGTRRRTQLLDVTSIPLEEGSLALGAHQAVFVAEFDGPRERTIRLIVSP